MPRRTVTKLAIALAGGAPPNEFRIFTAGVVDTVKGQFLFDEQAACSVMAEYAAHGIDVMVDYDHASLTPFAPDPAQAGKAAGWFNLEVRNGELWAVNVRWTEPAASALSRKEWRFMSPAFQTDESGRITALLNVALTNLPATRRLEPLMAASMGAGMDPKLIASALDALIAGDAEKCMEILKGVLVSAATGGDPDANTEDAPPPVGDGGADETQEMGGAQAQAPAPAEDQKKAYAAASARLTRLTGKSEVVAALDEVEIWKASHLKLEEEAAKLAAEKAALELSQRKENAKKLITLGAETPHTSGLADGALCKRLLDEPLDEQSKRVAALTAARGGKLVPPTLPTGNADGSKDFATSHGVVTLSASELNECKRAGAKPEVYAANKAKRTGAKGSV